MPLDGDYVASLRARTRTLIDLDFHVGGDQSSKIALRLFRAVHRKIGSVPCTPGLERELYAAAGELAEVTGWFLYDAGKHDLVRAVNNEALQLLRLSGDRSTELLTLQNMSMHAGDRGRRVEALNISRMVLESCRLSPRVQALFRTREARALALLGDQSAAEHTFSRARSLYLEGVRDDDPAWVWWFNDQELAWHEAMIKADTGRWGGAVEALQGSLEHIPAREIRRRYNHLANLLHTQVQAGAWREVCQTITVVAPLVDEVRSTRSANTLLSALTELESTNPQPFRQNTRNLRTILADAGYLTAAN